ncbi:MAG: pilus assembly protein TadG-related protein [Kiloniellales bacterium]|nr:pilus assembly protein TadG-related protein [Kiloniellales bacterium]
MKCTGALVRTIRRLGENQAGGTTVFIAVSLTVLLGAAAISIDYARAVAARQLLASAADAAVLAAASRLPDQASARSTALSYVEKNIAPSQYGQVLRDEDVEFGIWDPACRRFRSLGSRSGKEYEGEEDDGGSGSSPSSCGNGPGSSLLGAAPDAVRVTTRFSPENGNGLNTLFAQVFGRDSMEIAARAVAGRGGPPCVLALDPLASSAMSLGGSASVTASGCGVQVNSTASSALSVKGGANLTASDICVAGRASAKSGATSPEPKEYCPAITDPLAGLETPDVGACDFVDLSLNGAMTTLDPGVYCGGLDIGKSSDITLSPGLYIIQDGPLSVATGSSISGSEVTVFLTGDDALLSFKSGSIINLTAPRSGAMEGVLLFQDPDFGGVHDWKGKSTTALQGVIYFPSGSLVSKNDNAIAPLGSCLVLIAQRLEFTASGGASIDITQSNCRKALPGPYSRGVVLLD